MGYVLLFIGFVLAYLDYLGSANIKAAGSLFYQETFAGSNPFYKWAGAMVVLLAIGYIPDMEPVAMGMLILVLIVIILKNSSGFSALIKGA